MAALLLARHATVTVCHSRTRDLPGVCRQADVLVAAIGKPALVGGELRQAGRRGRSTSASTGSRTRRWSSACTPATRAAARSSRKRGYTLVGDVDFVAASRGGLGDHAGARRRRAADHRRAAPQHGAGRLSAARAADADGRPHRRRGSGKSTVASLLAGPGRGGAATPTRWSPAVRARACACTRAIAGRCSGRACWPPTAASTARRLAAWCSPTARPGAGSRQLDPPAGAARGRALARRPEGLGQPAGGRGGRGGAARGDRRLARLRPPRRGDARLSTLRRARALAGGWTPEQRSTARWPPRPTDAARERVARPRHPQRRRTSSRWRAPSTPCGRLLDALPLHLPEARRSGDRGPGSELATPLIVSAPGRAADLRIWPVCESAETAVQATASWVGEADVLLTPIR